MAELILQASDDLVARIAHESDPVRGLIELIWNAIDGEADTVSVSLVREDLGGIREVRVEDDGHGISTDEVASTFGRIGGSWKKLSESSKNNKRRLHGKLGEGRLRAFALGGRVTWQSVSDNAAGMRQRVTISGTRSNRDRFVWEADEAPGASTGTEVVASNDEQRSLAALDSEEAIVTLRSQFAPVLLNDRSLAIRYDGAPLDPAEAIRQDTTTTLPLTGHSPDGSIRIIEWRDGKHRGIYFGSDIDHFPFETSGTSIEAQFTFSAYVTWPGLGVEELSLLGLGDMEPGAVGALWTAVRTAIIDHFNARRRERRREQVKAWKVSGVYPYQGEPSNETERAERAVFDVVSSTLVPHISKARKEARLTLQLLRDVIRHDPDQIEVILHEVVSLSEADREALMRLLAETSLSAIVRSANMITSRNKFLAALDHLLFSPIDASTVGERDHLHKLLERELWIFGEAYHLMNSERGLTELLRTHLKLEGLPTKEITPVIRWDGKSGRVDLHLAAQYKEHDRIRHLVVELKAPDVVLTQKELNQVENYANVVRSTPAFATDHASWDFILIGTDTDELVDDRIIAEYRDEGRFLSPASKPGRPDVRGFVRTWRDLIDENRRRLDFVTSALEHDPSITEGLQHVRETHGDVMPPIATNGVVKSIV